MATKKATSTKKPTTRKKASPAKKTSKKTAKSTKNNIRSLRVSKSTTPFMTLGFTRETIYWLVLGVIVIGFSVWINMLQSDIQMIYDSIDANNALQETLPTPKQ